MPKKLSPEEATVMIIRRRLQQMEEAKIAARENAGKRNAANDDDIDFDDSGSSGADSPGSESGSIESTSTGKAAPKE